MGRYFSDAYLNFDAPTRIVLCTSGSTVRSAPVCTCRFICGGAFVGNRCLLNILYRISGVN
eukprot:m.112952 g.112952  ORF g.112952 m.112952 type:complete len:61 (-) comp17052_c0_seq2:99-281(-)